MGDRIANFFDGTGFMPHGMCYLWQPHVLWLNVGADVLIGLAYFSIPAIIYGFVRRRRDLPFPGLLLLFAGFILSCGVTHWVSVWTVWQPEYQLQGLVKLITGLISVAAAVSLFTITPKLLTLRSPTVLAALVDERTQALSDTNQRLRQTLAEQERSEQEREALLTQVNAERQFLEAVLDQMPIGVMIAESPSGALRFANRQVERLLRHPPPTAESVEHYPDERGFDNDGRPLRPEQWPLARAVRGETVINTPIEYLCGDDARRTLAISAAPIVNASGRQVAAVVAFDDITAQVEDRKALAQARQEADSANQSKSAFLANMSHEIRTPLAAILGYADVLDAQLDDSDNRVAVDAIRRNGRHLLGVLNDILDLSKIEAGRLEIQLEPVAVDAVVAEMQSLMDVRARDKRLPLVIEYATPLPPAIDTDPKRLRQILINLVNNAIKFTDAGEVRLRVSFLASPPRLRLAVIDTGVGLSAEQQARLFQPFTQLDTAHNRRFEGTGLGLAISQRLASMLGGTIQVDSQPGAGSTFMFELPLDPDGEYPLVRPRELIEPAAAPEPLPSIRARVLVVEDKPDLRRLAQQILQRAGAEVVTAADGAAALAAVDAAEAGREAPLDIVVMDMQMPVMDGYQTTRRLRAQGFGRPIIALTAGAMADDRERCLAAGCTEYLSKPVDGHYLVATVARYSQQAPQLEQREQDRRRVLLVEDSEDARQVTAKLLRRAGLAVLEAADGQSALKLVRRERPSVVLLDIGLPDMSGVEVAKQLREDETLAGVTLIALSGHSKTDLGDHGDRFDHYLIKPINWTALRKLLAL